MEKFGGGGGGQRRRVMGDVKMADEEQKIAFLCIRHFHISHNAPYFPPKILHKQCFQFLSGRLYYRGENKVQIRDK